MTWNELKAYIDNELISLGVDGDYEIDYIDLTNPDSMDDCYCPEVYIVNDEISVQN